MGIFSASPAREVRLERMRPEAVQAAIAERPAIYVPFGSIEWHGRHNPVGLDAIKAHEQLVGLAARVGGVVYPPVFFGAGGGHTEWPASYMVNPAPMREIVADLLGGFERDGFRQAILLSGHYPNRGEFLDAAAADHGAKGGTMRVLSIVENEPPGCSGDHAALYETSYMLYLHPDTVDRDALRTPAPGAPPALPGHRNMMTEEFREHPCHGLVGIDPRGRATAEIGRELTEALLTHLTAWLEG